MNDQQPHGPVPPARPAIPARILALLLLAWQPFSLAITMSGLLDELSIRGAGLGLILLMRLAAAGLGIAAGLAIFQRQPGGLTSPGRRSSSPRSSTSSFMLRRTRQT